MGIYPSTIYSGINSYPTTYTSGLFNTGLYSTGLTHIVKRDADAEAYGYRSYGWNNGNAGRWGGWGRGYWGNRGYSGWGRSYGRRWGYGRWYSIVRTNASRTPDHLCTTHLHKLSRTQCS